MVAFKHLDLEVDFVGNVDKFRGDEIDASKRVHIINRYKFCRPTTLAVFFAGALITLMISNFLYKKDPESKKCPDLVFNTFLIAFPMGLVGARIWFVLSELEWYMANPIEILMVCSAFSPGSRN